MSHSMPGNRIRDFFNLKAEALQNQYRLIESILPASKRRGSSHVAEEGRYIESLLRSFLNSVLPKELRAFSGFIIRPVTKTAKSDYTRRKNHELDQHSNQLDIIIYDVARYPVYEQVEELTIVPPEGVVAVFSVKKTLYISHIERELKALNKAVYLCRGCLGENDKNFTKRIMRAPLTGIVAFTSEYHAKHPGKISYHAFDKIQRTYDNKKYPFDMLVNQINVLDACCVFKKRPVPSNECITRAQYVSYHFEEELHNGLQFMLTGILSAYYDPTRNIMTRPGYTCFQPGKAHDQNFKKIKISGLRCKNNVVL